MTLWKNLVVALVAAFVLAACSSSDNDTGMMDPPVTTEPPADEQIAELQTQINTLRADLGLDPIDIDDLTSSVDTLTQQVARLQKQVDDAAAAAAADAAKAKKAMAAKLFAGLATEAVDAETSTNALAAASIGITSMGLSADSDGDGAGAPVIIKHTDAMVANLGVWNGTDHVRRTPTLIDHSVIYNNQDAPKEELFAIKYATQLAEDSDAGRLNNAYLTTAANQGLIDSDDFASGDGFIEHTDENGDVVKIRGSFSEGMGYYHCSQTGGTACRSTVDGAGGLILAGGWSFEPDEGAMAETPDADYVVFGWWSREVANGVDVATFAQGVGGTTDLVGEANSALTGTATYVGSAAGKYSINEPVDGDPNSGAFTADATLIAKFGNVQEGGTISGTLVGFKAGGESKDWTVALTGAGTDAEATIAADGFGGDNTASGTVWTIGRTAGAKSGSWSGDFYYESAEQETAANTPPIAAGTFSATHGNVGRMVGAFGTEKP